MISLRIPEISASAGDLSDGVFVGTINPVNPTAVLLGETLVAISQVLRKAVTASAGYAAWKYGMQANLPTGHAYKNAAPTVLTLPIYANNAAAISGGLAVGSLYRTNADPSTVSVVF